MHPEMKESLKLSDKGSFVGKFGHIFSFTWWFYFQFLKLFEWILKTFPFGPVYFYSGVLYNCNLLTLQISIDILSIFFNKQNFTLMLHFIYFIYLHLIHLCCKLSAILISSVIPLLIVASGYVIRGGALTILISRNQTSDVKSPAKCHEWDKIGWPVHL
jgi:hypothetical protein